MICIGADLGGTCLKLGIIKDGRIIGNTEIPSEEGRGLSRRLPVIVEAVDGLIDDCCGHGETPDCIGLGFPGIVNAETSRIISTPKYTDALDIDLSGWAKSSWNIPLKLENDSRLACIGEWKSGNGKGLTDFVMVTLGTGFGSSAVVGGKLIRGTHNQAGILGGHSVIDYKGRICKCGNRGCLETVASSWILPEKALEAAYIPEGAGTVVSYQNLCSSVEKGNSKAEALLDDSIDAWSSGIINLIHSFDPEVVIIGGGIMKSSSMILPKIEKRIMEYAWTPWGRVKLYPSLLNNDAALIGAYWLFNE